MYFKNRSIKKTSYNIAIVFYITTEEDAVFSKQQLAS